MEFQITIIIKTEKWNLLTFQQQRRSQYTFENGIMQIEKKITRANTDDISKIDTIKIDLTQEETDLLVNKFKSLKVYGWAFWNWNYVNKPSTKF